MSRRRRISIVAHGLRAGGGISVGKNCIRSLMTAMPDACFQVIVPAGIGYEHCLLAGVAVEPFYYAARFGKFGRIRFDELVLPGLLEAFAPDVILCLGNVGVRTDVAPQILLVQDSHYFYPPRHYAQASPLDMLKYRVQRYRLARDLKRTRVLLCQTRSALHRLRQWYAFDGPIHLLPNAISVDSLAGADGGEADPRIIGDFRLFYLTRYYPHKNIELILDLFVRHGAALPGVKVYLTLCPSHGRKARRLLAAVEKAGLQDRIINLGPVQQQDIAGLFRSMHALVMPSTLESFSGTYLEAMAFGCPVLTSDLDFAREVCGNAALYFDPWNVDSLLDSIQTLRADPALATRLVESGRQVFASNSVSWQQNAATLVAIVRDLVPD